MNTVTAIKTICRKFKTGEKGFALPSVLILLVLGGLTVAPLMTQMNTGLYSTLLHEDRTIEQYSGDSAINHAVWRLLYEPEFIMAMTPLEPTVEYSIDINNRDVQIGVTRISGLGGDSLTMDIDYIMTAGNQLELRVVVFDDDHVHLAYDTETYDSRIMLPAGSETISFYFHNNPTPPVSDTNAQADLTMDETRPTVSTLYNYDFNFDWSDPRPGRRVEESEGGLTGLELKEYQNWRSPPFSSATHLQGTAVINLYIAPDGFNYDNDGAFRVYLREYNQAGGTYTEIGSADYAIEGGHWVDIWTPTAGEGKYRITASTGDTRIESTVALGFGYLRTLSFLYR